MEAISRNSLGQLVLPRVWEIYHADDETGSFIQLAGPLLEEVQASNMYDALCKQEEWQGKKLILIVVKRTARAMNFKASEIKAVQGNTTRQ